MKILKAILLLLALGLSAHGQAVNVTASSVKVETVTGSCRAGGIRLKIDGTIQTCQSGTWGDLSTGGSTSEISQANATNRNSSTANGVSGRRLYDAIKKWSPAIGVATKSAHGLAVLDPIYNDSSGVWQKALATGTSTLPTAFVTAVIDVNTFEYASSEGEYTIAGHGLLTSNVYYLQNAGGLGTSPGTVSYVVGAPTDSNTFQYFGIRSIPNAGTVTSIVAGTGLSGGTITGSGTIAVNTSQNITTLSNLTSNGLVTTSGGAGTLGVTVPGTGVLAALGVNVGSAGAPVLFNGAGGTPSSLTLTNATGLPPTTGISGWPSNASGVLTNNGSGVLSWSAGGSGFSGTVTTGNIPYVSASNTLSDSPWTRVSSTTSRIGSSSSTNLLIAPDEIAVLNNGSASILYFNFAGGNIITGSGNVGMGANSPGAKLYVQPTAAQEGFRIKLATSQTSDAFKIVDNSGYELMAIRASGIAAYTDYTASTNSVNEVLYLAHRSTGTVATGFGGRFRYDLQDDSGNSRNAASIDAIWSTAATASRTSYLSLKTSAAAGALTERVRVQTDGLQFAGVAFASLGSSNNTLAVCTDCALTSGADNTCTSGGSGALAVRLNGTWRCFINQN